MVAIPVKGAFALGKKLYKLPIRESRCVKVTFCGSCGVWGLRCAGVAVRSYGAELRCTGVEVWGVVFWGVAVWVTTVWGTRNTWELWRGESAVCGSCGVGELPSVGIRMCGSCCVWEL